MNFKYWVGKKLSQSGMTKVVHCGCQRISAGVSFSGMLLVVLLLSALLWSPPAVEATPAATTVRVQTPLGAFDVELYDQAAPLTVVNFMNYVHSGAFNHSFSHRNVPGFITQFGGFYIDGSSVLKVASGNPVVNEFNPARSNLRGTVAMAKLSGDPDSATNQWFVNLDDNSANLDYQNGGFTVFGKITPAGMTIVDAIAALRVVDLGGPFTDLPVLQSFNGNSVSFSDLVMVDSIAVVQPELEKVLSDRVFDYLESFYSNFISPPGGASLSANGYYFRYYPDQVAYVATAAGMVYYFGPASENQILELGSLAEWLEQAAAVGY